MNFQTFIKEYEELRNSFPKNPTHSTNSENCEYGDYTFDSKNCYFSFENAQCTDCTYLFDSYKSTNCCDGDYVVNSEGLYECVDAVDSNNCTYLIFCGKLYDSDFCWDCDNSHHLFGCTHLSHKEYCIFNKQYTKEEYEEKVKELKRRSPEENFAEMRKVADMFPVTTTHMKNATNSDYCNMVYDCKNLYLCFDSAGSEDSAYLYDGHHNKFCFDVTQTHSSEFCYECVDGYILNECYYTNDCVRVQNSAFCDWCRDSDHLFGCVNVSYQSYCILNRRYTKEEYEKTVGEIMKTINLKY